MYESVWKDNRRRHTEKTDLWEVLRTYPQDYKVIFVGDATMSPYEIVYPGGSVEHWNEEAGADWMRRVLATYPRAIWLNPQPKDVWDYYESIRVINELMENRMFPMTIEGLIEYTRVKPLVRSFLKPGESAITLMIRLRQFVLGAAVSSVLGGCGFRHLYKIPKQNLEMTVRLFRLLECELTTRKDIYNAARNVMPKARHLSFSITTNC